MDWIPEFIWSNWGGWMSFLADERVEDIGSLLAGFIVFCIVFTLTSPVSAFALRRRSWFAFGVLVWLWLSVWMLTTYQIHDVWNQYQMWFITPLGAPIG